MALPIRIIQYIVRVLSIHIDDAIVDMFENYSNGVGSWEKLKRQGTRHDSRRAVRLAAICRRVRLIDFVVLLCSKRSERDFLTRQQVGSDILLRTGRRPNTTEISDPLCSLGGGVGPGVRSGTLCRSESRHND